MEMSRRRFVVFVITTFVIAVTVPLVISCNGGKDGLTGTLYVGGYSTSKLYVIDPEAKQVLSTIDIPDSAHPDWLTLSPDSKSLYFSSDMIVGPGSYYVYIVDTEANEYRTKVAVCAEPRGIAFTPDGSYAAVVCVTGSDIALIDTASKSYTNTTADTITTAPVSGGITAHPTLNKLYIAELYSSSVGIVNASGGSSITPYFPAKPSGSLIDLAITSDGASLYATGHFYQSSEPDAYLVFDLDETSGMITADSDVPLSSDYGSLGKLSIKPDNTALYAPVFSVSRMDYFTTADPSTVVPIDLSGYASQWHGPKDVDFTPDSRYAFVLIDADADSVLIVNTSDNSVQGTIPLPNCDPKSLVYKP